MQGPVLVIERCLNGNCGVKLFRIKIEHRRTEWPNDFIGAAHFLLTMISFLYFFYFLFF